MPSIAIGRCVFVNCHPGDRSGGVFLADESGKDISAVRVTDGLEVEVIAWRPRGAIETRYRVRVRSTGDEGWLPADNLRTVLVPVPAPAPPAPQATSTRAAPIVGGRRRFGQHFDATAERTPPSSSPSSGKAAPTVDDRRRRFGQHF